MNEELIFKLLSTIIIVVLIILIEEIICFVIIKKQEKYDDYKEYKTKKSFCTYSLYLYKDKKYLPIKFVVIALALSLVVATTSDKKEYYDALGNSYKSEQDVIFYDKNGNEYTVDKDTHNFIDSTNSAVDKYYVDINGYVVDIDLNNMYSSNMSAISYTLNGEVYFNNYGVYWDKEKRLHYYNLNEDIIVSDYTFSVDTETGNCTIKEMQ